MAGRAGGAQGMGAAAAGAAAAAAAAAASAASGAGAGSSSSCYSILANPRKTYVTRPGQGFLPRETAWHHQRHVSALVRAALAEAGLLPKDITLTASVLNVLDTDPPGARIEYSYDPFIGNPLGRTYKVGLRKKF